MGQPLRLGFAGSPDFAATILSRLLERFPVSAVFCQPPKPGRRGKQLVPCPVQRLAESRGIDLYMPRTLRKADAQHTVRSLGLDLLVVAAYGLILPPEVLTAPRLGCLNVHASLLPRWRGAAPIERAIMAGDRQTGVSLMVMDEGLDTGPVLTQATCAITDRDTGGSLHVKLAELGASLLMEHLARDAPVTAQPQSDADATYAPKLTAADAVIDWRQSAVTIDRQIRALRERMPTFTHLRGERIRILAASTEPRDPGAEGGTVLEYSPSGMRIACGHGVIRVTELQLNRGKGKPLAVAAVVNGYPHLVRAGDVFDAPS